MNATAIFGPPGTGKSTHLSKVVKALAVTTPNMAVVSFTKAAAGVLTSRLPQNTIRYVGTLHALAFRMLGLSKSEVADEKKFCNLTYTTPDDMQQAMTVYNYAYHHGVSIPDAFVRINPITPFIKLEWIINSYLKWKDAYGYTDFNDMVANATGKCTNKYDVIIVDEAQDCTNKQWDFVHSLLAPNGKLIIGGDDDQSLFTWCGANPHAMVQMADSHEVLSQSYRVPIKAYQVAEATVGQINNRVAKTYYPTAEEGQVSWASYYDPTLYPDPHTVLCRDKWQLEEVESLLLERGAAYTRNGERSMYDRPRCQLGRAIMLEDYHSIKRMSKYLRPEFRDDSVAAIKAGWRRAVDFGRWVKERDYLNIVNPCDEPQIHISTIHGFKGEEDDNVVVMADCTSTTEMAMDHTETYDNEVRVWYVALTRCRHKMTIVGHNKFIKRP